MYIFQEALAKKYSDVQAPDYLGNLEKLLKLNKGGNGYWVGTKVSLQWKVALTEGNHGVFISCLSI